MKAPPPLQRVIGPRVAALAPGLSLGRRRLRRVLLAAGFLLAILVLLQPLWGEDASAGAQRADVVVCLDVSQSMLARDVLPSRLERARGEIRALAGRAQGDRIGLVAFAGEARLVVPLTEDMNSLVELLDETGPLSVARGGTNLGAALEAAVAALGAQDGVVLLLSDGEDLEESGLRAAEQCRERGIRVHCLGLGSPQGSKIPVEGEQGETFLRDREGHEVVTAMNPSALGQIAEVTGGELLDAGASSDPLLDLYERRIRPSTRPSSESEPRDGGFRWLLLAAFLLWILELALTDRRSS